MTQRTYNIIMCCKGNDHYGYTGDPIYSIKNICLMNVLVRKMYILLVF